MAVVDFDVHHGDGSEEILRKLHEDLPPNALFFASIHLYDPGDAAFSPFYPSSGASDSLAHNVVNVALAPMAGRRRRRRRGQGGARRRVVAAAVWLRRAEWRAAFAQRIIPCLRAAAPTRSCFRRLRRRVRRHWQRRTT